MAPVPDPLDADAARRIAIRAQLLDGSATGVLDTVRRLGFLQLDPITTVATPQELVLWSRLGAHDRSELDRLLWQERSLFEWNAFVWPAESLPIVRGLMRRWRTSTRYANERWMTRATTAGTAHGASARVEPVVDRTSRTMRVLGAWGDVSRLDEALDPLAAFLEVERV